MGKSEWKSSYDELPDRFAGIKRVLARIFGDGENPLAWGFPFLSLGGTRYKIHLLMVVYLLAQLIFTLPGHKAGPVFVIPNLIAMVALVLLHEIAHAMVAKRNGGESDQRMLWPLGGLEPARFEDAEPINELRTALAGPALHLALLPVFIIPLVFLTESWDALLFNPLSPSSSIHTLMLASDATTPWWLITIWAFHVVNLIILLANFLPMAPFDAGAVLRIILSKRYGDLAGRHKAALSGLWIATGVGICGLIFADAHVLLTIAIVAGIVCTLERRRLQFLDYAQELSPGFRPTVSGDRKSDTPSEPPPQLDLDRILEKISISGINSLTRSERRTLKKATESSRNSE